MRDSDTAEPHRPADIVRSDSPLTFVRRLRGRVRQWAKCHVPLQLALIAVDELGELRRPWLLHHALPSPSIPSRPSISLVTPPGDVLPAPVRPERPEDVGEDDEDPDVEL